MANNRMAIVCKECNLGIAIAKFYPQGGWLAGEESGWGAFTSNREGIEEFFVKHAHEFDKSMWGGEQYYLGYEMDHKDWKYEPRKEIKITCDDIEEIKPLDNFGLS